jgi:recombinational DNA repair protein (RecF pathway)
MSMNTCKCGDVYDTDEQMHSKDGECICDRCWERAEDELDSQPKSLDDWRQK